MSEKPSNAKKDIGLKIKPTAAKDPEIGIDTNNTFAADILDAVQIGMLDVSSIDALNTSAQTREQTYALLDMMAQDSSISAVLETYAEDVVQTNDRGEVIWVESDDAKVLNYTSWLIDTLNIDKHLYKWAHCLITYGDVYLRLYRNSDVEDDVLFKNNIHNKKLNEAKMSKQTKEEQVNEAIQLRLYSSSDKYIPYVQMVDNPGEMFDLQRFGKTYGYIKTPVNVIQQSTDELYTYLTKYKMNQSEIELYDATTFVHGCLEATNQRQPETVDIYLDTYENRKKYSSVNGSEIDVDVNEADTDSMTTSYSVKRGQSLLYNTFRLWRELNLLEMSALLNRLTKSALVRILNVDVGDMPKEQVQAYMQRLKEKIEQKSALSVNKGMSEYTNPGPIENTIYVPVYNNHGSITQTTIGGDFDPKSLVDLEYFRDQLYGSLKVPKQFFGVSGEEGSLSNGTSLTIISARYGKAIKNIQNILCQMVTDLINLFLIDRGLSTYINRFRVRMQAPVTQEELDRRSNADNRIRYVGELMNQLGDIEDKVTKLKIYKSLLSSAISDPEVVKYLQEYIDELETEKDAGSENSEANEETENQDFSSMSEESNFGESIKQEETNEDKDIINEENEEEVDSYLPSPAELGIDLLDNKE